MTDRLPFHFSLSCIGEGSGNPLQCSCLENPRDRGTWWAAIYGVAQSRTPLKQLTVCQINIVCQVNIIVQVFFYSVILFLPVLDLQCFLGGLSQVLVSGSHSLVVVHGLPIVAASLVAEHRL